MEELICVKSKLSGFKPGRSYSGYSTPDYDYVIDETGCELVVDQFGDGEYGVFDGGLKASFTAASNRDACADDSEGGCRE
ncbi:hypothetical protein GY533_003427 [Escherichia coli]|nr:hypothetical protein [Escherichia coli]